MISFIPVSADKNEISTNLESSQRKFKKSGKQFLKKVHHFRQLNQEKQIETKPNTSILTNTPVRNTLAQIARKTDEEKQLKVLKNWRKNQTLAQQK